MPVPEQDEDLSSHREAAYRRQNRSPLHADDLVRLPAARAASIIYLEDTLGIIR